MISFLDNLVPFKSKQSVFDAIEVIDQLVSNNPVTDEVFIKYLGDGSNFYSEFTTDLAYFISLTPSLKTPLNVNEAFEEQKGNDTIQVVLNSIINGGVDVKDTVVKKEMELSSRFVKTLLALCSINPLNDVVESVVLQRKLLSRLKILWYLSFFETLSKHAIRSLFYSYTAYYAGLSQDTLSKYLKLKKPSIELSPFCTWLFEEQKNFWLCALITELALDSFSSLYELHESIPVLLKVLAMCVLELDQSVEAQAEAAQNLLRAHSLLPGTIDAKLLTTLYTRNLGVTLHLVAENTDIQHAIHLSALTYIDDKEYYKGMATLKRLAPDLQLETCKLLSIDAPKLYYPPNLYNSIEDYLKKHSTDWLPLFRFYTHNNDYKSAAITAHSNRCSNNLEKRKEALVMAGSSLELCEHKWINYNDKLVELSDIRNEMVKCRASICLGDQFLDNDEELLRRLIEKGAVWEAYELFQRSTNINPQPLLDFLQGSVKEGSFGWLAQFLCNFSNANASSPLNTNNERLAVLHLIELVKKAK